MNPVETHIEKQDSQVRPLLHHLRLLILSVSDEVQESVKWSLPFFNYRGKIWCYLSPIKKTGSVDVSFLNGTKIAYRFPVLRTEDRKRVASYRIESLEELDENELLTLIEASIEEMG